jgi:hypothetical protein
MFKPVLGEQFYKVEGYADRHYVFNELPDPRYIDNEVWEVEIDHVGWVYSGDTNGSLKVRGQVFMQVKIDDGLPSVVHPDPSTRFTGMTMKTPYYERQDFRVEIEELPSRVAPVFLATTSPPRYSKQADMILPENTDIGDT